MSELMFNFLIISGLIMPLLSFYDAFRVQMYRGIAESSKLSALFVFLLFIIQNYLLGKANIGENSILFMVIIIVIALVIIIIKLYVNGRSVMIYSTSKATIIERVRVY